MSQPNDCTHCAEWEICPFHPKSDPFNIAPPDCETVKVNVTGPTVLEGARKRAPAGLRLLGPDDPEVSSDLIYLNEATGGVVGVPSMRACVDAALDRAVREGLVTPGFLTGVKLKVSI